MNQLIKMKKGFYLGIIVLFIGIGNTYAQQEPMFTQYSFNSLTINPAIAGSMPAFNVNALTRLQWIGMDGAPKTFSLTAHTPLGGRKIGVGATLVTDKVGPVSNTFFTLNYAYRLRVNDELTLSMGIKGGISSYSVGLTDLSIINGEDPQFQENEQKISPNLGFGFYLYSEKYYVGFSAPKLIQTTIDDEYATDENQLKRHYYIFGGYNWQISSDWILKPSLLTKIVSGSPVSNDITIQTTYIDRFGGGLMYRIGDALGLFVNGIVYEELAIGYGYEYSLNGLSGINGGTHEIMLMYNFKAFSSTKKKKMRIFRF
jgi:type IX secretion system PorP/SprF family membrane protein